MKFEDFSKLNVGQKVWVRGVELTIVRLSLTTEGNARIGFSDNTSTHPWSTYHKFTHLTNVKEMALPCPHCGTAIMEEKFSKKYKTFYVQCPTCKCQSPYCDETQQAILIWNRRNK